MKSDATSLPGQIASAIDDYLTTLKALNRSPKTIAWYHETLVHYFLFIEKTGRDKPLESLGVTELKAYIFHLQSVTRWPNDPNKKNTGQLSPFSIQGYIRSIKAFWGWMLREDYIKTNPLARFPLPAVPHNLVKTLSIQHIRSLLNTIDRASPTGAKYYCILLLLLDTGMRISELTGIKMADIDPGCSLVTILGKGSKQRQVPISALARRALMKFIRQTRPLIDREDSSYLFPAGDGGRISINSVQQFLRRLARRSGLGDARCSPHVFRHVFATEAVAREANPFVLKEVMGHSSLQTTLKYIHPRPEDVKVQHAKFSPLNSLLGT